jgi:integrase
MTVGKARLAAKAVKGRLSHGDDVVKAERLVKSLSHGGSDTKEANAVIKRLANGEALEQKIRSGITLSEVIDEYIAGRDLSANTATGYRYIVNDGHLKVWASKPVADITEDDVFTRHQDISLIGKTTATNTMRVLRLALKYAKARKWVDTVATDVLKETRAWARPQRKSRTIKRDDLPRWLEAVKILPNQKAKTYLLMGLYMGFRCNEMLALEWSNVDFKKGTILALDTKNGTDHTLPMPDDFAPYIQALYALTGKHRWVFSGEDASKHMTVPKKPIAAVVKMTDIEFSSHDLRRTFASTSNAVGNSTTTTKFLMNHATANDVTDGYIIAEEHTLKEAINRIAGLIK